MWGWYKVVTNRPPPPGRVSIANMTADRITMYTCIPQLGEIIPIIKYTFIIDKYVYQGGEIYWSVQRLHLHRSGRPSQMQVDPLQGLIAAATWEQDSEIGKLEQVVDLVHTTFR